MTNFSKAKKKAALQQSKVDVSSCFHLPIILFRAAVIKCFFSGASVFFAFAALPRLPPEIRGNRFLRRSSCRIFLGILL
jgi:hypothetical protein